MARLTESKPAAGAEARTFDLPEGEAAVIGRSASKCNVPVPGAAVSGIHATISRGPEAFLHGRQSVPERGRGLQSDEEPHQFPFFRRHALHSVFSILMQRKVSPSVNSPRIS